MPSLTRNFLPVQATCSPRLNVSALSDPTCAARGAARETCGCPSRAGLCGCLAAVSQPRPGPLSRTCWHFSVWQSFQVCSSYLCYICTTTSSSSSAIETTRTGWVPTPSPPPQRTAAAQAHPHQRARYIPSRRSCCGLSRAAGERPKRLLAAPLPSQAGEAPKTAAAAAGAPRRRSGLWDQAHPLGRLTNSKLLLLLALGSDRELSSEDGSPAGPASTCGSPAGTAGSAADGGRCTSPGTCCPS